jgi:DNA-binding transcriptional regulator GbsR (MarR family)
MDKAAEEFIEQMGVYAQADGLSRIAGRMLGFFIMTGGPHSFSEVAKKLKVSRASISTNARILESFGAIERTSRAGDRQDYFKLAADPYARMLEGSIMRIQRTERLVTRTLEDLSETERQGRARLKEMLDFYGIARKSTQEIIREWSSRKPGRS